MTPVPRTKRIASKAMGLLAVLAASASHAGTLYFTTTADLNEARAQHTATALADGKVLVSGGMSAADPLHTLASAEIYDPATKQWKFTSGEMGHLRAWHTATLLETHTVLVVGGTSQTEGILPISELYDPKKGWRDVRSRAIARSQHTATLLVDGRVLVVGGIDVGFVPQKSAQIFDPINETWTDAASMATPRRHHTATLLSDGTVLVAGGSSELDAFAEIYDARTNSWTPLKAASVPPRYSHTATKLNNAVLFAGGTDQTRSIPLAESDLYSPSGPLAATRSLRVGRVGHATELYLPWEIITCGGISPKPAVLRCVEVYDSAAGWSVANYSLNVARYGHTLTLLKDGSLLVVGGFSDIDEKRPLKSVEIGVEHASRPPCIIDGDQPPCLPRRPMPAPVCD